MSSDNILKLIKLVELIGAASKSCGFILQLDSGGTPPAKKEYKRSRLSLDHDYFFPTWLGITYLMNHLVFRIDYFYKDLNAKI